MEEIIETGTVSSRGQICIPNDIRNEMGLIEGSKVVFLLQKDTLVVKKANAKTFAEITKPLKDIAKETGFKESEVERVIEKIRKKK